MSLPPITLSDLDPASNIDPVNDLMLLRQGFQDKKATVNQIAAVRLEQYNPLPAGGIVASDVMLVGRLTGVVYDNYIAPASTFGFNAGTRMWFGSMTPPLGWNLDATAGDRLLAVSNGGAAVNTYNNSSPLQGTWQQLDVGGVSGQGLNVLQIPNHQHWVRFGANPSSSQTANPRFVWGASNIFPNPALEYGTEASLGIVGGAGDVPSHDAFNACDPHHHGNNWRPAANVGCIGIKS